MLPDRAFFQQIYVFTQQMIYAYEYLYTQPETVKQLNQI